MEIQSNGSKWLGQEPDSLETLLDMLKKETLNPAFERYGNFVLSEDPIPKNHVRCWGNFLRVSHVFSVEGTPEELATLITAIRANQETEAYKEARVSMDTMALVNGQEYTILETTTASEHAEAGRPKLAEEMRKHKILASCLLRRPKGIKVYMAHDYGPHPVYGDNRRWRIVVSSGF